MRHPIRFLSSHETNTPEDSADVMTRKFVRIKEVRVDGLVVFEFSIGWPEQMVELVLPQAAFDEFCATHQAKRLVD